MPRNKRKEGRGLSRRGMLIWLLAIVGTLTTALFLTVFYVFEGMEVGHSRFLYEEAYRTSNSLKRSIRSIDRAIFEVLYENNIPEKDVHFLSVSPRQKNGQTWELTKVFVRCKSPLQVRKLEKGVRAGLKRSTTGALEVKERAQNKVICLVKVGVFTTHKLIFSTKPEFRPLQRIRPKVALIIDDLGYAPRLAEAFMDLNARMTLSVLPYAPYTRQIAERGRARGYELMLHLPMEPKNYPQVNPGPGCLMTEMTKKEITKVLSQDLAQIPGARGVNNHMGSLFTEDEKAMGMVFEELRKRRLFYVDSRTTRFSKGYVLARQLKVPVAKRDVFIDNDLNGSSIKAQVIRMLNMARRSGKAIGIAHPHKETLEVLRSYLNENLEAFELVPVSEILDGAGSKSKVTIGGNR